MQSDRVVGRRWVVAALLFVAATAASVAPVRSYDSFWHLATGRWMVEHHALPLRDPFSVAADRVPWINGEWLFDVIIYALFSAVGFAGLSWLKAAGVGALFAIGGSRDDRFAPVLAALALLATQGHFDVRPSSVAALLLVVALIVSDRPVAFLVTTIVWINVHPSALLAPLIPLLRRRWRLAVASAAALLVNPFGWRAIAAPFELLAFVRGGTFVNAEWLPSRPSVFPLLYFATAAAVVLFIISKEKRGHAWLFAFVALLAVLAVQHVRNQGLFFAALPLLGVAVPIAPRRVAWLAAVPLAFALAHAEWRTGIDEHRFPVRAVARLQASGLRGNVYDADQFGGFLEWTFHPERRTLTDGRNELQRTYIAEYARARRDERAWRALLRKYRVDLAVEEYRRERIETIDGITHQRRFVPASLAYFPRREWALIAYDDVAMVFARRAAFSEEELRRWELPGVVPDAN